MHGAADVALRMARTFNIAFDLKALPGLATDVFNAGSSAPPLAGDANPAAPTVSEELP